MRTLNDLSLGERLLISRKRAGLTSRQMSARLRVAPNTISSWEADRTSPGYLQTLAWADACGIEPDALDPDIRNRCSDHGPAFTDPDQCRTCGRVAGVHANDCAVA